MKNNLFNSKIFIIAIIGTLLLIGTGSVMAAQEEKVDICHFDSEYGVWELINISSNAIEAHLANHDDAFPTQTTGVTGTYLDENCEEAPGLPSCGDCLTGRATPGCEVPACETEVCSGDLYCCVQAWDGKCVDQAAAACQGSICN